MSLYKEWHKTCQELGVGFQPLTYFFLRTRYAERQRFYHKWSHIEDCFRKLDLMFVPNEETARIKMALFWHDAVYDPMRKDNEDRSCDKFVRWAVANHMGDRDLFAIVKMIELTKDHDAGKALSRGEQILIDVDMSIMAADLGAYMDYAQNIWLEYKGHGRAAYMEGRKKFLASVDPTRVFATPEMQALSSRVRRNIDAELSALQIAPESLLI